MIITGSKISKMLLVAILIPAVATGPTHAESAMMDKAQSGVENAGQKADSSMNKVGNFMDDNTITAKAEAALADHESTKSTDISVRADQKVVILSGFVESQAQARETVGMAKGVEGVTSVSDRLHVRNSKDISVKGYADDTAITSEVKAKLLADDVTPSRKMKAGATDGAVQLSGTADSQVQSGHVESIIKAIDGVKGVKNDPKTQ